jgi:tRNA pseudouridine55 synthase
MELERRYLYPLNQFSKDASRNNQTNLITLQQESSDPRHGFSPAARPVEEYLKYGFIALDKPRGPSSHEVVAWVRKMLGCEKAGHSGTLDPMVSGVLPIGLGSATKALSALLLGPKEYVAVARIHDSVSPKKIEDTVALFLGPIYQKPPQRSSVRRATRTRSIYEMEILEQQGNLILLRILCEAGTYVRKLIYDLGEILAVGATMVELRRTRVCQIDESDLVRLHDLFDAESTFRSEHDETRLRKIIRPIEEAIPFLKEITVRDSAVESICNGAQLALPGVLSFSLGLSKGELVKIMTPKGELVALSESQMSEQEMKSSEHGIVAITRRVIMESGTYPKMWKSKHEVVTAPARETTLDKSVLDSLEENDRTLEER